MTISKSQVRAVEYRQRALQASAAAEACILDHPRERHERAAARWAELADDEERRSAGRVDPPAGVVKPA